jgi:outer membrane protein TolC
LQNVADTLHVIQADADALKAAHASEQATKTAADLTRKQYEIGYVNYQTLLAAEQSHQLAVISLIQAQTNRFGDTAALYQALGGGWWNRPVATAMQDTESPAIQLQTSAQGEPAR